MMLIKLTDEIDLDEAYQFLQTPQAGAVTVFAGTVRNHSKGKEVIKLVFEAYENMAVKELEKVAAKKALEKWSLDRVVVVHAFGEKLARRSW